MRGYDEILRYMGHPGGPDERLEKLISACLEKLDAAAEPRHVTLRLDCDVKEDRVSIGGALRIHSKDLAVHLAGSGGVYLFAATLGAGVDRLIAQRVKIDSAEALAIQACAAARVEEYCDTLEQELAKDCTGQALFLRRRFSPGYGDFDLAHQTDILRVLQAHKMIGVTETATHMLTPLKSVSAVIGIGAKTDARVPDKCAGCGKQNCPFRKITIGVDR